MNKGLILGIIVIAIVWITITLALKKQEEQQIQIRRIEMHVQEQDSLISSLVSVNGKLQTTIIQRDSLLHHQKHLIHSYERAMDSLSVIMQYLERSDLSKRYRSRQ
ncbi:hypothetical protein PZB74_01875 [Porifericola rhodea]|uniref:hypothetical protein n=1 Tax=Porifericola rhodea TaxID=930972 RepID=UPI0026659622|nr:hypothetical protein [Porifericola rhodea]WKN32100.1 hypothetical protein PZB74_01875 [Porifericola rhodea]